MRRAYKYPIRDLFLSETWDEFESYSCLRHERTLERHQKEEKTKTFSCLYCVWSLTTTVRLLSPVPDDHRTFTVSGPWRPQDVYCLLSLTTTGRLLSLVFDDHRTFIVSCPWQPQDVYCLWSLTTTERLLSLVLDDHRTLIVSGPWWPQDVVSGPWRPEDVDCLWSLTTTGRLLLSEKRRRKKVTWFRNNKHTHTLLHKSVTGKLNVVILSI